jgi:hypothetical protein
MTGTGRSRSVSTPGGSKRLVGSDFGVEIEECVEAAFELCFDLFPRPLDHVHGDVSPVAVGQFEGCILDFCDLAFGQKPESVDKS